MVVQRHVKKKKYFGWICLAVLIFAALAGLIVLIVLGLLK